MPSEEGRTFGLSYVLRNLPEFRRLHENSKAQRSRLSMVERHRAHLASAIEALQAEISRLHGEVTPSVGTLDSLRGEVARLKKDVDRTAQSRLRFQKKSRSQTRENEKLRAEVSRLSSQADLVPDLEKAVSELSEEASAWKKRAGEAERQLDLLRGGVR